MPTTLRQIRSARWANLLIVNLRILLGFAFLPAGLKKVLGERFTDAANTGAFHEFLHAFYATGFFYRFVGAVQLLIAVLLMTQTFGTLGALLALPVFTTITVLCWSTGAVFTGVMSTLMLLGAALLCLWDSAAWRGVFVPEARRIGGAPPAPASARVTSPIDLRLWRGCGIAILVVYLASCLYAGGIYRPRGLDLASVEFYVLPLIALVPVATWAWERDATQRRVRTDRDRSEREASRETPSL